MQTAGDILREIIYVARTSQLNIGKEMGFSQITVSRVMNDKIKPSYKFANIMLKLAKKYKVKVQVDLEDLIL